MTNLEKYRSLLTCDSDGLLLTSRYNRMYAAEFDIAEGIAIVSKTGARYFTDSRYIESAQNNIKNFEVIDIATRGGYVVCLNEAFGISAFRISVMRKITSRPVNSTATRKHCIPISRLCRRN